MNSDEIIHVTAKQLFCYIIDRDEKKGTDVMMKVIEMGPQSTLRFLGELSNKVDQFRHYLGDCAEYGLRDTKDFDCAIRRFCKNRQTNCSLKKIKNKSNKCNFPTYRHCKN